LDIKGNLMKYRMAITSSLTLLLSLFAWAQTSDDLIAYVIPDGAKRLGPFATRSGAGKLYDYLLPGAEMATQENRVGSEIVARGVTLERRLFKNGQKHGVQREWYTNAQLKSERPYRDGAMDGLFRHWDEQGRLIGQYQLVKGSGLVRIYDSSGVLVEEASYKDGLSHGLTMTVSDSAQSRSFVWYENDRQLDRAYGFYEDGGALRAISYLQRSENRQGVYVRFLPTGTVVEKIWTLNGKHSTEAAYAKAAAADPTLPPYYEDATRYKEFVTDEVKALLAKYRALPKVKIPLQIDAAGNPVLAP